MEEDKYYKTPWYIKQQVLSVMQDSEIAIIIWDKRKEWGWVEWEKKLAMKWYRWDNRKIIELLYLDEQNLLNKTIKELQYVLKSRTVWTSNDISLEDLKENVSIVEVIETLSWIRISNTRKLIRCPLHKDNTASLKIYTKTNSFFCQWCHKWWSPIDFIKHFHNTTTREAILKLTNFYNKWNTRNI